ncbi:MAG: hypothetical protein P8165_16980 [Deltaproteobacteria bacterium]
MSVIKPNIFSVVRRFPRREQAIKGLFRTSDSFRTLCEDYHLCTQALERWNAADTEVSQARVAEYSALMEELEAELIEALDQYHETQLNNI